MVTLFKTFSMFFVLLLALCAYLGYKDKKEHSMQETTLNIKDRDSILGFAAIWLENILIGFTRLCNFVFTILSFIKK